MEKKRVLFISQEINPFLAKTELANFIRKVSQGIHDSGKEIRVFMPKFGAINERRHQLHEVIRLSGMNLIIDDHDHPLIIKVASVPSTRIQVYFIDNEEYFKRKSIECEEDGLACPDNDERSMFFCRGVMETVKKLGWKPDAIVCTGWMSTFMPLYIKDVFANEPHFNEAKLIYSVYEDVPNFKFSDRFIDKLKFDGFSEETINALSDGDLDAVRKYAMHLSDGVVFCTKDADKNMKSLCDSLSCHQLDFDTDETPMKLLSDFVDKIVEEPVLSE
jgi:starch synthase